MTLRHDYPLAWSSEPDELAFYVQALTDRGLLKQVAAIAALHAAQGYRLIVTQEGWSYTDEQQHPRTLGNQAFVAMSFSPELSNAWTDGIKPGLELASYRPFRTDAQPSIDRIDVQIMTEIRKSRLLVADVTLQRPGVYFEAGFAIGLGIPVFWSVRKDDPASVHFDTRQYNHTVWESEFELAERIWQYVYAVLGPPTERLGG